MTPFEPEAPDPEMQLFDELERELRRVVLPAIREHGEDEMHGISLAGGESKEVLARLRELPDGASHEEVMKALSRRSES
jgi:hypothetical protein